MKTQQRSVGLLYSNKSRGQRIKKKQATNQTTTTNQNGQNGKSTVIPAPLHQKEYAKSWAMLLKKVWAASRHPWLQRHEGFPVCRK